MSQATANLKPSTANADSVRPLAVGFGDGLGCVGCQYHANDWRLCLHPLSAVPSFWADTSDYSCFTPVATGKKFCGSQPQQNPARINGCSTSSADLMPAIGKKFAPILVSQNQTKPARVVWGVQTSPDYVAWCGSKGYAESFLKKVIFGQSGETAPGAAGAQMQGRDRDMDSQQTKQPNGLHEPQAPRR